MSIKDTLEVQHTLKDLNAYLMVEDFNTYLIPLLQPKVNISPFKEMLNSITTLSNAYNALYNGFRVLNTIPEVSEVEENSPEYTVIPYIQSLKKQRDESYKKMQELTKDAIYAMNFYRKSKRWCQDYSKKVREELMSYAKEATPGSLQKIIGLLKKYSEDYGDRSPRVIAIISRLENLNADIIGCYMPMRRKMLEDLGYKEAFMYLLTHENERLAKAV